MRRRREQVAEEADTDSFKALKAGKALVVRGGHFTIDAEDDAVHSNGDVTVAGGTFLIKTGDDAFHADASLRIDVGEITISKCFEGLEGSKVDISGGNINIDASDDAINAAGGSDEGDAAGGPMGGDRFSANSGYYVRVTGGVIDALGASDGIDSNGNVFLDGGTVRLSAQSMGMSGAIDFNGSLTITGGDLITAGSSLNPSSQSTQPSLLVSYSSSHPSGSALALKDADGNVVLSYTSRIPFTASAFASPKLEVGKTYVLSVDGADLAKVTLGATVTAVSDSGGEYRLGRMGGRRGW
jgi:hypothetical protein